MRMLSSRTCVNDVVKHKNMGKRGQVAYEQRQLRLLSAQTRQMRFQSTRSRENYVAKHENNDKSGD